MKKVKKFIAKVTGKKQPKYVDLSGIVYSDINKNKSICISEGSVDLDVNKLDSARYSKGFGQIYRFEDRKTKFYDSHYISEDELEKLSKENPYMIDFGCYPQGRIDTWEVEELMNLQGTGRSYTQVINPNGFEILDINDANSKEKCCPEFRLANGKRIVRSGDKKNGQYYEVEPISWVVEGYEDGKMRLRLPKTDSYIIGFSKRIILKEAFVVAPELLKLSGVKNIDYLIEKSNQDECEKVL